MEKKIWNDFDPETLKWPKSLIYFAIYGGDLFQGPHFELNWILTLTYDLWPGHLDIGMSFPLKWPWPYTDLDLTTLKWAWPYTDLDLTTLK